MKTNTSKLFKLETSNDEGKKGSTCSIYNDRSMRFDKFINKSVKSETKSRKEINNQNELVT